MSLLNALEEERLEVMKLLEEMEAKNGGPPPRHMSQSPARGLSSNTLKVSDKRATGRSLSHSDPARRKSSSSMVLDDGPYTSRPPGSRLLEADRPDRARGKSPSMLTPTGYGLQPSKSTPASSSSARSKSETRYIDPSDPYQHGSSYYYKSAALRPTISSTSSRDSSVTRAEKPSRFKFWKSTGSPNNGSSAAYGSSSSRGTSKDPNVDMDKLRLSLNAQVLTGSTSSSSLTKPTRPRLDGRSNSYSSTPVYSSLLAPTRSTDSSTLSPQTSRSYSAQPKHDDDPAAVYRRLSSSKDDPLGQLYSSPTSESRRLVDEDESSSSDDSTGSSSEDSDSDDDSGDEAEAAKNAKTQAIIKSLLTPAPKPTEPESKFKVKSLLDVDLPPGAVPPPSMAEYAAYKRRIIHPNTAFDNNMLEDTPYTSDTEELLDARRAAKLPFDISTVHSILGSKRMVRTMSRGENIPSLTDPNVKRPKTFLLGSDLSPESAHALEWTIGTVLRDSNVLYVVCAFEDEVLNGTANLTPQQQEDERMQAMNELTTLISKLLKRTRLQVHVIIEVIHCKSPKHLLTAVVDYVNPTMVVLGSRGRGALKGVLLGSFSNYVVERSSVPVMVARRKLQKTKHKDFAVRLANNLRPAGGLSTAKVD